MLKKGSFGLLALVLVSFALDPFPQEFARPWVYEYHWPGNSSIVDYTLVPPLSPEWNIYKTQATLDRLAVNSVAGDYSDAPGVDEAQGNYSLARNIWMQVDDFTNYFVVPYVYDIKTVCAASGNVNCACIVIDRKMNCNVNLDRDFRYFIATRWLSADYEKAWKGTIGNALDALETRAKRLNAALAGLETSLWNAEYAGVCGKEVAGHEYCEQAEALIAGAGSGGGNRNFSLIRSILENNTLRVYDDVPLIEFGWPMNLIGNENSGVVGQISAVQARVEAQVENSTARYERLYAEAAKQVAAAERLEKIADSEELWKVNRGAAFGEIIGDSAAAVSEGVENGKLHIAEAKRRLESADAAVSYRNAGYLRDALANATDAMKFARLAYDEISAALEIAQEVIETQENEARVRISEVESKFGSNAWPSKVKALYDAAEAEFNAGLKEGVVGRKFWHYSNAAAYADAALEISPGEAADTNWSALGMCALAEVVLDGAKKDGISVEFENAYLSVLKKSDNASALLEGCSAIVDSISESAKEKYDAHLSALMAEAHAAVEECGEDCADLALMLDEAETGLVSAREIAYPGAIGSLAELGKKYMEIIGDVHESMATIAGGRVLASASLYSEDAMLDGKSKSNLEVIVANTGPYEAKNTMVEVESKMEFSQDDVVIGGELLRGVVYLDGKLRLYLKAIGSYEQQRYVFEKNDVLMKTENAIVSAVGYQDYSAVVNEEREVTSIGEIARFGVGGTWEELYIDGTPAAIGDGGIVSRMLDEGTHIFEAYYVVKDAYSRKFSKNMSTKIGERTYQRYQVEIIPAIDMEYVETFAEVPQQAEIKEKQVITVTGEKVEALASVDGFVVRVYGLKKGKGARFEVSYYVDNTSAYINKTIKELNSSNISNTARQLVAEAQYSLDIGDEVAAVEKVQQAYDQIKKDEVEVRKLTAERDKYYTKLAAEMRKIENALAQGVYKGWLYSKISARMDYLRGFESSLSGMDMEGQVAAFSEYDDGWLADQMKAYKKNTSGELNSIYMRYLDSGSSDARISEMFGKVRTRYDEFEASGSLVDAFLLDAQLEELREMVEVVENVSASEKAEAADQAEALLKDVEAVLDTYAELSSDADGSRFESLFKVDSVDVKGAISGMTKALGRKDMKAVAEFYGSLSEYLEGMKSTIKYVERAAQRNAHEAEVAFAAYGSKLGEKERKKAASAAATLDTYLEAGEYVKALKASDELMDTLSGANEKEDYSIVLLASAVFVLAVIAVYYFNGRFGKGGKKEEKIGFRPLEKAV